MAKKRAKKSKRLKFWIGKLKGKGHYDREVFSSRLTPTESSHGGKYGYVTGPYSTKKRAKKEIGE